MESKSFSRIYFRALTSIHIYNGQICTEEAVKTSVCMCVCVCVCVYIYKYSTVALSSQLQV